jgi:hypothetical protein
MRLNIRSLLAPPYTLAISAESVPVRYHQRKQRRPQKVMSILQRTAWVILNPFTLTLGDHTSNRVHVNTDTYDRGQK